MIEGNPSGPGSAPHRIFTFNMIFRQTLQPI